MGRIRIAILLSTAGLVLVSQAAAQPPTTTGAYDVLAAERLVLLKKREGVLQRLAQYESRARAYEDHNRRVAAAISAETVPLEPTGKFAADARAHRLASLRLEVRGLRRQWSQLNAERGHLVSQLDGLTKALNRVHASMAALKAVPAPGGAR